MSISDVFLSMSSRDKKPLKCKIVNITEIEVVELK